MTARTFAQSPAAGVSAEAGCLASELPVVPVPDLWSLSVFCLVAGALLAMQIRNAVAVHRLGERLLAAVERAAGGPDGDGPEREPRPATAAPPLSVVGGGRAA